MSRVRCMSSRRTISMQLSIRAIPVAQYDILVEYTRTWAPQSGVIGIGWIRKLLERFS